MVVGQIAVRVVTASGCEGRHAAMAKMHTAHFAEYVDRLVRSMREVTYRRRSCVDPDLADKNDAVQGSDPKDRPRHGAHHIGPARDQPLRTRRNRKRVPASPSNLAV